METTFPLELLLIAGAKTPTMQLEEKLREQVLENHILLVSGLCESVSYLDSCLPFFLTL